MHTTRESPFGSRIDCDCGRVHQISPDLVVHRDSALSDLPDTLTRLGVKKPVAVLMDERTRAAAGDTVTDSLAAAGWEPACLLVPDPEEGGSPVCDDRTLKATEETLPQAATLVAVGSGVISDLTKWLAFQRNLPYVVVATAASMNGYASANVAPTIEGVKSIVRARPPRAVVATPDVLAAAPYVLTTAGLGDILAKSVSSADWKLNHLVYGDYHCERAVTLIADIEPLYLDHPAALRAREPRALAALFDGLLLTGAAMTMAESSSPASGGEHLVSHTLDMMSALDGHPHDLHGRQVGIGTVLASEVYRRVLEIESPRPQPAAANVDRPFWGRLADEVEGHYAKKRERLGILQQTLSSPDRWAELRQALTQHLRSPERLKTCLREAGAAHRAEDLGIDRGRLRDALLHGHELRARVTVLDLAWMVGILPDAAEELVATWA